MKKRLITRSLAVVLLAATISAPIGVAAQERSPSTCGAVEVDVVHHPARVRWYLENFGLVPSVTVRVLDGATTNLFIENFGAVPTGGDLTRCTVTTEAR